MHSLKVMETLPCALMAEPISFWNASLILNASLISLLAALDWSN